MFDILPNLLASIASFLFPLFASYKALKTSDPAQLTPWLMYWSVLSCALLVESWTAFILVWVPFYSYMRLFFLLYLVLPQTQGARQLYEAYLHPFLEDNEVAIEDFIASAHDRLKAAGMAYLKQAIEYLKTNVLGMPPTEADQRRRDEETRAAAASAVPGSQGYTQALLARFSVPAARWASGASSGGAATASPANDFYNMLAGAVGAMAGGSSSGTRSSGPSGGADRRALFPDHISGPQEKMSFIAAQRERLAFLMSALDREAQDLEGAREETPRPASMSLDGGEPQPQHQRTTSGPSRPPSGHSMWSALSKSRSEVDFEKIDASETWPEEESGEEGEEGSGGVRRRGAPAPAPTTPQSLAAAAVRAPWTFLGWGSTAGGTAAPEGEGPDVGAQGARSSGVEQ